MLAVTVLVEKPFAWPGAAGIHAALQGFRKDGVDMTTISKPRVDQVGWLYRAVIALAVLAVGERDLQAGFTLEVTDSSGAPVSGFRWLVEEDNTNQPIPGEAVWDMLAVDIHKSHAPVVAKGHTDVSSAFIDVPSDAPYVVSVLPDSGHTIGGGNVAIGQGQITVIVNAYPVPTAQISILAFQDNWPINNAPEVPIEAGLQGFTIGSVRRKAYIFNAVKRMLTPLKIAGQRGG